MSYPSFEHSQQDHIFPHTDPGHQTPTVFPVDLPDQARTFSTMDPHSYGGYDERDGYPAYNMANSEEAVDAARGPRLTQEQLAQLELEFAQNYKPNTDHKKILAERMGVDYSKVTNWFQNRRAKAKHEGHAHHRSDRSIQEMNPAFESPHFDYKRASDSHLSANFSSPIQAPLISDDLGVGVDFNCINDVPPQYYPQSAATIPISQAFDNSAVFSPDTSIAGTMDPFAGWSGNGVYSDHKLPTPSVHEITQMGLMSASPSVHSQFIDLAQDNPEWHRPPMYNSIVSGELGGNPSSQSFATSTSEDGEQAHFITPPQETSPLPGHHQERVQHDRQASNSSELAENLDVIHLQQPSVGPVLHTKVNNMSKQQSNTTTGLLTPEVSPDTAAPKLPFAKDIASRRKRQRPAALKPEQSRSASYAGPTTNSPSFRVSPPASGKMSPVRRVKSTGNPLTVMTGRVRKPGPINAQMSPRNLDSCLKAASMSENQTNMDNHMHNGQNSGASGETLAAPSPTSLPPRRQGTWPEFPAQVPLPSTSWNQPMNDNVPNANMPSETGWAVHQPEYANVEFAVPLAQPPHMEQYPYHLPPQSAPSHVTTFDAASLMPGNMAPEWQMSHIQPEPYRDDTRLSVPFRPGHPQHHSHSGPFECYQPMAAPYQPYNHPMGAFFQYPAFSTRTPTPPQKALDIKVETGPPPPKEMMQVSQERKEYTFENAFADDPHFATGSKK